MCTWSIARGYIVGRKNKNNLRFHREVMKKHLGNLNFEEYIDHINKNKADNRKSNLRVCSSSVNQQNRKVSINSSTGYKGVRIYNGYKNKKMYRVAIARNYKDYHIGYFENLQDAISARKLAEKEYHFETYDLISGGSTGSK